VLSTAEPDRPPGGEPVTWHGKITVTSRSLTLLRRVE
jgi:hypothetical protein